MGLIINAPNVHQGGGLSLLQALIDSLDGDFKGCLVLDERMPVPRQLPDGTIVHRVPPTIRGRLMAEWRLRKWAGAYGLVLCFGNLPPLFKLKAKVLVFVQNRYQIDQRQLKGFPFFSRFKITLERFWFTWRKKNVTQFIVQTPSMQRIIQKNFCIPAIALPFFDKHKNYKRIGSLSPLTKNAKYDFVYVASGEPHKNHIHLIEAWTLLAKEEIRPSLCLTLDENSFTELCRQIEHKKKRFNLNIVNAGVLSKTEIQDLYRKSRALIYPSDMESLGLPLIEARCVGLPILASERDYVRDVIDPEQTFDPNSFTSIARAVKRFMGRAEQPLPLIDAKAFLDNILSEEA